MQKKNGFTLVELLVAMLVGLVLLTASGAFYLMNLRSSMDSVKTQQFDKTVQVFVDNVVSEIRRACYARNEEALPDPTFKKEADSSCIRLSHSVDGGSPKSYGFKFIDDKVFIYSSLISIECDSADGWEELPGVSAKNASFSQGADCGVPDYKDNTVCFEFDAEGSIPLSDGTKPKRRVESLSIIRNPSSCNPPIAAGV